MRSRSGVLKVACPSRLTLIIALLPTRPDAVSTAPPRSPPSPTGSPRRGSRSSGVVASKPSSRFALLHVGDAHLHVVARTARRRRSGTACPRRGSSPRSARPARARCRHRRREVEVLVERLRVLDRQRGCRAPGRRRRCSGAPGSPSPRMCSGSWPLSTFCTRSGTTWLIASLTLPRDAPRVGQRAPLADADAVERPARSCTAGRTARSAPLREVLAGELLEAVGATTAAGMRRSRALGRREHGGVLEHHRRARAP